MEAFRYLNPFENSAVHEEDVWGEGEGDRFDVESIHADVSRVLLDDLRHVAAKGTTRVRFLVGSPGIGKSHLFSRLRRQIAGQAAFAFASIPPSRPQALPFWILERVISGLQHRRLLDGELKSFSQLDALIYRLLMKHDPALQEQTEDLTHEVLSEASSEERDYYLNKLRTSISTPDASDELVHGLLHVLRPETRRLALRWLSGTANLTESDLAAIGQASPLDDGAVRSLLVLIGSLARRARLPLVLVLDQLDLMTEPAQVDAFQDLLFLLIGKSHTWYIVTGLNLPRYEGWLPRFTQPLMSRLQAQSGGSMPTCELLGVSDRAQKQDLLERRLGSTDLAQAREAEGIKSKVFPLLAQDVATLSGSPDAIVPRSLLTQAAALYERRVSTVPEVAPVKRSLSETIRAEYELRRARLAEVNPNLDRAVIADRVADVIRLVARKQGRNRISTAVGPLESSSPGGGTHSVFTLDDRPLHVVGHHMHKGAAFPTFAEKVLKLAPGVLFVRAAAASISGAKSMALMQQLRERHAFIVLSNPDLIELEALAQLLADWRAGDLRSLDTEPPPTDEAVERAALDLPVLDTLPLADAIRTCLAREPAATPPAAPAEPELTVDPLTLVPIVRDIMRPLRWLALERLCWILRRSHRLQLGVEELGRVLRLQPFAGMLELHPAKVLSPGQPQIIIFVEDERA